MRERQGFSKGQAVETVVKEKGIYPQVPGQLASWFIRPPFPWGSPQFLFDFQEGGCHANYSNWIGEWRAEKQAKTRDQRESQRKGQSDHSCKEQATLEAHPPATWPNDNIAPLLGAFAGRGNLGLFLEPMSGVPKTTLPFGDLPEALIELSIYLPTH